MDKVNIGLDGHFGILFLPPDNVRARNCIGGKKKRSKWPSGRYYFLSIDSSEIYDMLLRLLGRGRSRSWEPIAAGWDEAS